MSTLFNLLAKVLACPPIANYLIRRAARTPYSHLDGYMERYWLVPYNRADAGEGCGPVSFWRRPIAWAFQRFGIALRIHHILREDWADHPHSHPWRARSFILRGFYFEERTQVAFGDGQIKTVHNLHFRGPGTSSTIWYEQFHKITQVSIGGVWTLFVTREYQGGWGFLVDGVKVPWRDYAGRN